MKFGLITYFRENYGSALQCFATKTYVEALGFEVTVFERSFTSIHHLLYRVKSIAKHIYKSILYKGYFSHYFELKKSMKNEKKSLNSEDIIAIDSFINEKICPQKVSWKELCCLSETIDYKGFICGSDQIWNPNLCIIDPIYFLKFCNRTKRIAYAPSFGSSFVPNYNRIDIINGLSGFDRLSVREETGCDIVKDLINSSCERVPDPVFLLSRNEWVSIVSSRDVKYNNFCFIYFLNEPTIETVNFISKICNEINCFPLLFSHHYTNYIHFNNAIYFSGDPLDFVSYILNSDFIFTDSFHASVFSIILEKNFFCFERNHNHKSSQGSRIVNLLNRFGLSSRYVKSNAYDIDRDLDMQIDYAPIREIVKNEYLIGSTYLKNEIFRIVSLDEI